MEMNLRKPWWRDVEILFYWKNDAETRRNSGNTGEVAWEGHFKWFTGVMADPKGKIIMIAEMNGIPVGLLRTSPRDDGNVEIHYTVSPNFRRQGVGKEMVKLFVDENDLDSLKIVLPIKDGNLGSEKIAQSLGLAKDISSSHEVEPGQPPLYDWRLGPSDA